MRRREQRSLAIWSLLGLTFLCVGLGLSGCKGFFTPQGNTPPPTTNTGDYLYLANGANAYIAGFSVSTTGSLSVLPNSPFNNGIAGLSLAITPNNSFLYVATSNGIYEYAIGSNGSITIQNNAAPVVQDVLATAMQVDATGSYLLAAGIAAATQSQSVGIYQINTSTGILTALSGSPLPLYTGPAGSPALVSPTSLLITPNNALVYVSLGTLGVQVLTFGSGGALSTGSAPTLLSPRSTSVSPSDYGLASDPNTKFLFVAEINTGLRVFSIGTNGSLSEIAGSPYTTGAGPTGVIVDPTGVYVYVANKGGNSISAFSLNGGSGVLTAVSGSPFPSGGQTPLAFANDNSGKYLAVINSGQNGSSGNNDLQLFSYSTATPGALVAGTTATTGTDPTNPSGIVATFPASQ